MARCVPVVAVCALALGMALQLLHAAAATNCHSPLPGPEYNKLVPDMTVIPLPMAVSLQPMMITDILPQEQTFVLIGYLFFSWTDRRLAFNATRCNSGKERYVLTGSDMDQVWRPQLEFPNAKAREINPEEVNVWSNGFSLWVGRIQLTLRARLDVSRFPFDSHVLTMIVEEFDHPTPELRLIPTPPSFIEDTTGSQFDFDPTYTVERLLYAVPARNTTWDQLSFAFHAKRIAFSSIFNVVLPVLCITSMSFGAFLLPRKHSETRVGVCITAFLAAIAFSVTLQSTLPPVRYPTRMSIFVTVSYVVNFAAFVAAVVVGAIFVAYDKERERGKEDDNTDVTNPLHSTVMEDGVELVNRAKRSSSKPVRRATVFDKGLGTNVVITLPDSKRVKRLKTFAGIIDNMFRLIFPVGYTIFLFLIFIV